jgi:cytochrome c peroxidase
MTSRTHHIASGSLAVILGLLVVAALPLAALPASGLRVDPGPLSRTEAFARASAMSAIGRKMFFDPSLSASGRQACVSCHDPGHAFGPPNALSVQLGGPALDQPGFRAVPSLRYLQAVPQFTGHFFDSEDEGDESVDNGPTGGLTWDGRADRGREQARIPLLSPHEMANSDAAAVVAALSHAPYADEFRRVFGEAVFDHPDAAFEAALGALGAFEQSSTDFYPYSSKYDAYLAGKATLSPAERRGLTLFEAEDKGNCASCHISSPANDGEPPQFTDFGLIAVAVPRNRSLPANADPEFFDLGACGPFRTDLKGRLEYCGLFRTPTLRNVATRQTFFHNGIFHSLRQAVEFYATRDTDPGKWYAHGSGGTVEKFDDLPQRYWANVNMDPPFGGKPGGKPMLNDQEIDDIVAFLQTLTDGYGSE